MNQPFRPNFMEKTAWFHRDCTEACFECWLLFLNTLCVITIMYSGKPCREIEPNAFEELLHRHNRCDAKHSVWQKRLPHAVVGKCWELVLCRYCGPQGIQVECSKLKWSHLLRECDNCKLMLQFPAKQK
jgi:hypothetical protein